MRLLISKVYDASKSNDLTYYVVLKEDTFDTRDKFFHFLSSYETLGFNERLPIFIKFLPERVMEKANLENEIVLN